MHRGLACRAATAALLLLASFPAVASDARFEVGQRTYLLVGASRTVEARVALELVTPDGRAAVVLRPREARALADAVVTLSASQALATYSFPTERAMRGPRLVLVAVPGYEGLIAMLVDMDSIQAIALGGFMGVFAIDKALREEVAQALRSAADEAIRGL